MYQCKDNTKRILTKYLIIKNASSFYLVFTHKQVKTNVIMTSKYVNIVRHIGLFLHGIKIWHWCKQFKLIKTEYGKIKFFRNRRNPLDAYDDQESHSCYRMIRSLNLENHTSKLSFTSLTKTSIRNSRSRNLGFLFLSDISNTVIQYSIHVKLWCHFLCQCKITSYKQIKTRMNSDFLTVLKG